MKVRAKCVNMVINISKFYETQCKLYIIICVTFIQLGANIYDNTSCIKIMEHISDTRVKKRLHKFCKATITFTVFVCQSVTYISAYFGRMFLTFYTGGKVV